MSVQQIIDLQNENAALRRDLAERKRCCRCGGPEMRVPESYRAVEAFMSADEVVVLDDVDSDDETHSCDAMGCGSLGNHVVERLIRNTRPADAVRDGVVIPNAVVQFLLGAAPIDGKWFGDLHPKHPGRLWWRRLLRAALVVEGK